MKPCLIDTSIVEWLTKYDLLTDAFMMMRISRSEIMILRETTHRLMENRDRRGQPIYSGEQLEKCKEFCASVRHVDSSSLDSSELLALQTRHEIWHGVIKVSVDKGESILFACTKGLADFALWTADKKSLIALSKWPNCGAVHSRICGRVYCLERIIREVSNYRDFDFISKLCPGYKSIDVALKLGESGWYQSLLDHEGTLANDCNGLLAE